MKMGSLFRPLLLVTIVICLAIGLACLIVGAVGDSWWNNVLLNNKIGLWRTTIMNITFNNKYVLKFSEDSSDQKKKGTKIPKISKIAKIAEIAKIPNI